MSKRMIAATLMLIGLLAIGISACQSQATEIAQVPSPPTATATPTTEKVPTATATTEPTKVPTAVPTATPTATSVQGKDDPTPTVTPTSAQEKPAPTPTRPWQIPEVRESDWQKGGHSSGLIIVEYGDYQ
jgi:hypothetical protein